MKILNKTNIIFFHPLVWLSVVLAVTLWMAPNAMAKSKAQEHYDQNNWTMVEFSSEYTNLINNFTARNKNSYGYTMLPGNISHSMALIKIALKELRLYTSQKGRNEFGGGMWMDSAAIDQLQLIGDNLPKLIEKNYISKDEADIIYNEANKLYEIGSERAFMAADAAGKTGRMDRIKEQNKNAKKLSVCTNQCLPSCYYDELSSCAFCPLFEAVFTAASKVSLHGMKTLSKPILSVVIVAFAVWIAFQILAFVSSPEVKDFKDLAASLITQGFIVLIVIVILNGNVLKFFYQFLNPVYLTGQHLAQATIRPETVKKYNATDAKHKDLIDRINTPCMPSEKIPDEIKGEGGLPKSMGDSIICTMTMMQNRVAQIRALGRASICYSWKKKWFFIPALNYLLVGIGLWVGTMILTLVVPFMMIDSVFQLAIAGALLPFAVGSYAFKITRGYSKKIWETFLNSTMLFVVVSITSLILLEAYQQTLVQSTSALSDIYTVSNDANIEDILKHIPWYSPNFLQILFIALLSWGALKSIKSFGGEFASSISSTNFGSQIGTMVASFTKSAATKILQPTAEAAWKHSKSAIKTIAAAPIFGIRRAVKNKQVNTVLNDSRTQINKNGEYVLETRHWWGGKKVRKVVQNADGSSYWVKEKYNKKGELKKRVTKTDNITNREKIKKNANGDDVAYKTNIKANSSLANVFIADDGTVLNNYEDVLATIIGNSDAAKRMRLAMAQRIMQQRMPNISRTISMMPPQAGDLKEFDDGSWGYVTTRPDGTQLTVKIGSPKMGADGKKRIMTTYEIVSADGKNITQLKSDGLINRKIVGQTSDGTMNGLDMKNAKIYHGLSENLEHKKQNGRKQYVNNQLKNSLFDKTEFEAAIKDIEQKKSNLNMYEFAVYHK